MVEIFIIYALSLLKTPYIWGGNSAVDGYEKNTKEIVYGGLDCSGYVMECLRSVGLAPKGDHTAQGIYNHFINRMTAPISARPNRGDLLFFGKDLDSISHIGIALDAKHFMESGGGNSKTTTIAKAIKANAMVRIRPIDSRKDFLMCVKIL